MPLLTDTPPGRGRRDGKLFCEVCGFDFRATYGERGDGFIEGHHTRPVSGMEEGDATKVEDIAMVCANCHRMLHRKPLSSIEELTVEIGRGAH